MNLIFLKTQGSSKVMDINNARKIINYNPQTSLRDGLKLTWNWFLKNNKISDLRHNYLK